MLCAGLIPTGAMYDVIDAVTQFIPPPECHLGCMNWTAALNASERAASFADPSVVESLGAACAIPGRAIHSLTQPVAPVMDPMEAAAFYGPICPCRNATGAEDGMFEMFNAFMFNGSAMAQRPAWLTSHRGPMRMTANPITCE